MMKSEKRWRHQKELVVKLMGWSRTEAVIREQVLNMSKSRANYQAIAVTHVIRIYTVEWMLNFVILASAQSPSCPCLACAPAV
jgi:hypothetical protein